MLRKFLSRTDGDATVIGVVIAALVAIIVGVLIWYKINTAIYTSMGVPLQSAGASAGDNATRIMLTGVTNTTNATANTIWTLFPIVAIVLIAGIILTIVMAFGRGKPTV